MNDRVRNINDMFIATREFNAANAADYATLPDAAAKFSIISDVISKLDDYFADQTSGAVGQAVEMKSVLLLAMRRKMMEYAAAARALNIDDPGFRRLFRIPDGDGVQVNISTGREFVGEITLHKAAFERFGLDDDDLAALVADIDALEEAVAGKLSANSERVGATAGVDFEVERGMDAEIFLDAMMKIVYRNNAAKLGEWKSARHVRRSSLKPKEPAPTA
jgi:hypothetical protein